MRLQEVYSVCKSVQETWNDLSFDELKAPGNITYFKLKNANIVRETLSALNEVELFRDNIMAIKKLSYGFAQATGDITIDSQARPKLTGEYKNLYIKVCTITELFESLNYGQNSEGFDIKLPPNISLAELSKCTKDLDTIFSTCPLFLKQDGSIKFSSVDIGSVWLSFLVVGTAGAGVLRLVAELVDKALIIRSHYLTTKEQVETIKKLQLGNEILENTVAINKQVSRGLLNNAANELAQDHDISDNEDIERLKNSIQLMADWMNKGMEVYASIQAPTETKAVFPPIEKQTLPEGMVALLTDGSEADT